MKHGIRKKVFHPQEENLIRADQNPAMHLCAAHREVVHSRAEAQKPDQKELLVRNRLARGKAIRQEEKFHTLADQHQKASQNEAPIPIGVVSNRGEKRKPTLQEGKHHTQADQHLKTDQNEAPIAIGVVVNHPKGNHSVNQASKAVKGLRIENSVAVHQKIQDISHFVNRLIHPITNLHSRQNAAQKIDHYVQEKNLQKNLA